MNELQQVAVVTGASRGIGKAIALRLAEQGFIVVVNFINNKEAAEQVCQEISQLGFPEAIPLRADVRNVNEVQEMFDVVKERFGGINVLINNAGIIGDGLFLFTKDTDWWHVLETNLRSVTNCCRLVLPDMISQRSGIIVNMTSISGRHGAAGQTAYAAAKAGIVGFSKSLAREVGRFGIAVNCVAPGLVDTDMIANIDEKAIKKRIEANQVKRLGTAGEIAEVVALLTSGKVGYLFGQEIVVDGGTTM